jgi:hypothetical protein
MSPVTHFFTSWVVANTAKINRRERALVTIAGVIPDVDGLVIIANFLTRYSDRPLQWWGRFHHVLAHNVTFALVVTLCSFALARRRWVTACLVWVSFHLHLLGDLVGSRGPDGYQWPIPYFWPFSNSLQWIWKGQWALNAWPNFLITGVVLMLTFFLSWKLGYSPFEMASRKVDRAFVGALRERFG